MTPRRAWPRLIAAIPVVLSLSVSGGCGGGRESVPSALDGAMLTRLVDQTRTRDGFTVDPRTGSTPTSGYGVNIGEHACVVDARVFFDHTGGRCAGCVIVRQFVRDNAATLRRRPALRIGAWYDRAGDRVVLSPVELVPDREVAIRLGIARHQRSVYDFSAGRDIPTGDPGNHPQEGAS